MATARIVMVAASVKNKNDFDFKIVRSKRRTLSVEVRSGYVIIRSPLFLPRFAIDRFLKDKHDWIIKKLSDLTGGEDTRPMFLGRRLVLKFSQKEEISEVFLTLSVRGNSQLEKSLALEKFYKQQTRNFIEEYLDKYKNNFSYSKVEYKKYKSRWGSCSPSNNLSFNLLLSMCPKNVIEYIVVHELCHTRVKNHSRKFYQEVIKYMPNYKEALRWLRKNRGLI